MEAPAGSGGGGNTGVDRGRGSGGDGGRDRDGGGRRRGGGQVYDEETAKERLREGPRRLEAVAVHEGERRVLRGPTAVMCRSPSQRVLLLL